MTCSRCGYQNRPGVRFCEECGRQLAEKRRRRFPVGRALAVGLILILLFFVGRFVYYAVDVMFRASPDAGSAGTASEMTEEEILAIADERVAEHTPWLAGTEPTIQEVDQLGQRVYAVTYERVVEAGNADAVEAGTTTLTQRLVVSIDPETGQTSIAESH